MLCDTSTSQDVYIHEILLVKNLADMQRPPFSSGNSYIYHWERKHGRSLLLPVAEGDMRETYNIYTLVTITFLNSLI